MKSFCQFNLFKKITLLIAFSLAIFSCSDDESDVTPETMAKVTIDGTSTDFTIMEANYSYVDRRFNLIMRNNGELFNMYFRVDDLNNFSERTATTDCDLIFELLRQGFIGSSIFSTDTSSFDISSVKRNGDAVSIVGEGSNLELVSSGIGGDDTLIVDKIELAVTFTVLPKEDLNFISFNIGGEEFTYYGAGGSGYLSPYFFPNPSPDDDIELILTANRANENPRSFVFEGISLIDVRPTYPPTQETISGYSEGLRILFLKPEIDGCDSNLMFFENENNLEPNFNSTSLEITNVEEKDGRFILSGKFSGKITETSNDIVIDLQDGEFRFSVPTL